MKHPRTIITLAGLLLASLSTSAFAAQTLTLSLDPAAAGPPRSPTSSSAMVFCWDGMKRNAYLRNEVK